MARAKAKTAAVHPSGEAVRLGLQVKRLAAELGLDDKKARRAGLLHDIGWYGGKAGHSRRGALMVFTDETLPFDLQERGIISTAVASHRGRVDPVSLPYYPLLLPENQKRALMLTAMLRIADGLDFLHTSSVSEVHCTSVSDKVFIDIHGTGDLSAEKDRARIKGDIFARVFRSRPVIR